MELPIAMYVKELSNKVDFDFHLFNTEENVLNEIENRMPDNTLYFKDIKVTNCPQSKLFTRVFNELFIRKPFYDNIDTTKLYVDDIKKYDFIWVTNAKIASVVKRLIKLGGSNLLLTSNDAIHFFYFERSIASLLGREIRSFSSLINLLRIPFILLNEISYIKEYSKVHIQTDLEKERLKRVLPVSSSHKLVVIPNGVKTELFSLSPTLSESTVLLMNHMTDGREHQAKWFIEKIWKYVLIEMPQLKLLVVGALPDKFDQSYCENYKNVKFAGFVNNIDDVYRSVTLSVIPHYQSSGFINRAYDAMGAGVPLIVSPQIAKTMTGFVNGFHGIIAFDRKDLIRSIIHLIDIEAEELRNTLSYNAREFVKQSCTWKDSTKKIEELFNKTY